MVSLFLFCCLLRFLWHESGDADDKDSEDEDWVDSDKNCFDLFNDTETDEEDSQPDDNED